MRRAQALAAMAVCFWFATAAGASMYGTHFTGANTTEREFVLGFVSFGPPDFDLVGIRVIGAALDEPVFSNFTVFGWERTWTNLDVFPTMAAAQGPFSPSVAYNLHFFGIQSSQTFALDLVLFSGEEQLITTRFRYTDGVFTDSQVGFSALTRQDFIPAPGGMAIGVGCVAFGALRRRR